MWLLGNFPARFFSLLPGFFAGRKLWCRLWLGAFMVVWFGGSCVLQWFGLWDKLNRVE